VEKQERQGIRNSKFQTPNFKFCPEVRRVQFSKPVLKVRWAKKYQFIRRTFDGKSIKGSFFGKYSGSVN